MAGKKGFNAIKEYTEISRSEEIAKVFYKEFERFCETGFNTDDKVTLWLYEHYIKVLREGYPEIPCEINFRSSGSGSCKRELTMAVQAKSNESIRPDKRKVMPHHTRWTAIGTSIGDVMQMFVLLMEKHYERLVGEPCSFKFERLSDGAPNFEQFSTKYKTFSRGDVEFSTGGSVDGVLIYTDQKTFEETRIGFEVKSKQSSYSATGHYSMKSANDKHIKQITNYAMLNELDHYMIVYLNAAHQAWNIKPENYAKYPDVRVFGIDVTQEMKDGVIENFFFVAESARDNVLPPLELDNWMFNDYKTACAKSLSYEELEVLEDIATPKQEWIIEDIKKLRGDIL